MSSTVYDWGSMPEPTEPVLPRAVALAWGVAANPQRGPKRELSIERIVDVAVELADSGGLSAVSMSSVATALGFTPMSLYRYVTAKDDLLVLMQERGIGVPPESINEVEGGWRPGLRTWAQETLRLYEEHPWLLDIPIEGAPQTPNNLAWLDSALQVLDGLPLDFEDKVSIVLAIMAQIRWQGTVVRSYVEVAKQAGMTPDALDLAGSAMLEEFVTPEQFPFVYQAVAEGVFSPVGGGDPFAFGLERVLDGVEAFLAASPAERRSAEPLPNPLDAIATRDQKYKEAVKARREAEKALREARKRERERLREARDRAREAERR
jgi:AcrR family transcriptional regulator